MKNPDYLYVLEKFAAAVYELATGPGDVRGRLYQAFFPHLIGITPEHMPEHLKEDMAWIRRQLTRLAFPGSSHSAIDSSVSATLSRIRNSTGVKIAKKIVSVEDALRRFVHGD